MTHATRASMATGARTQRAASILSWKVDFAPPQSHTCGPAYFLARGELVRAKGGAGFRLRGMRGAGVGRVALRGRPGGAIAPMRRCKGGRRSVWAPSHTHLTAHSLSHSLHTLS
eukprot:4148998-Prymnesium_polylepis.1